MAKTLLIDGNNAAMRGIHAMARSGLSADGVATGPLLAFINSLSRHVREERPDRVVVCWDAGPSEFRVALAPNYKAHRKQPDPAMDETKRTAFGLMKEFLSLAGVHQVERHGFEADDLIAYYVHHRPLGDSAVIVSGDKDFLQLVGPRVEQVRLSAGGAPTDRWTRQRIVDEYGCEPSHLALAMALAGDATDGVPGVPRFGMKTAIKTLAKFGWDLDAIDHPTVTEYKEQVATSLLLVDLRSPRRDLTLPPIPAWNPTRLGDLLFQDLVMWLVRYEMSTIKQKVYSDTLWSA